MHNVMLGSDPRNSDRRSEALRISRPRQEKSPLIYDKRRPFRSRKISYSQVGAVSDGQDAGVDFEQNAGEHSDFSFAPTNNG